MLGQISKAANAVTCPAKHTEGEDIGIARIMLRNVQRGASAHMSGFFEADRLLMAWKSDARTTVVCEFTLLFTDGALLRGSFTLTGETRGKPALRSHISHTLRPDGARRRQDAASVLFDADGRVVPKAMTGRYALGSSVNKVSSPCPS